jgi:hypothetical protein
MKYIKQMSDNTIPGVLRTFRMPVLLLALSADGRRGTPECASDRKALNRRRRYPIRTHATA